MKKILIFLVISINLSFANEDYITAYTYTDQVGKISVIDDFIWVGTWGGLIKYDPVADTFRIYHKFNSGFASDEVRDVFQDKNKSFWVRGRPIMKLTDEKWSFYDGSNFLPLAGGSGTLMALDTTGNIWLLSYPYIRRISGDTFDKSYYLPDLGFQSDAVFSMVFDRNNSLWLSTRLIDNPCEVIKITSDTVAFRLSATGMLKGRQYPRLAIDSLNNVWIATDSGVTKFDGINFTDYISSNSIIKGREHYLISAGKKYLWVSGPDSTIYKFDFENEIWSSLTFRINQNGSLRDLVSYKDKALLGFSNSGMSIADSTIKLFKNFALIPGELIFFDLIVDKRQRILGLNANKISVINPDLTRKDIDLSLFGIEYDGNANFCIDSSECIWLISKNSLIKLNSDFSLDKSVKPPFSSGKLLRVLAIDDTKVWLLTEKQLWMFDGNIWQREDFKINNKDTVFRNFGIDRNKNLYVIGKNGIFIKTKDNWDYIIVDSKIFKKILYESIKKILPDNKGGFFILTNLPELYHYNDNIWKKIDLKINANNNQIRDMVIDHNDVIWIFSTSGISTYDGIKEKVIIKKEIYSWSACVDNRNNIFLSSSGFLIEIKNPEFLPDNFVKAVKLNYLVFNTSTGKYDKEIESPEIYEIMPNNINYNQLKPVGYFKNDTKDRFLNFEVNTQAFEMHRLNNLYDFSKLVDSSSLADDPEIKIVDDSGNTVPFNDTHGLPPGMTARVEFKLFSPQDNKQALSGDIIIKTFLTSYDLDNRKPFPLEDFTDDTITKRIAIINISDGFHFSKSVDKLFEEQQFYTLKLNPQVLINSGTEIFWNESFSDNGTNHINVISNSDKSITLENKPYMLFEMNRLKRNSERDSSGQRGGDRLTSHIIDFRGKTGNYLKIDFSRGELTCNSCTPRGFSSAYMVGPERRVISPEHSEINEPDKLIIEFISADENNKNKLLNPNEDDWITYKNSSGITVKGIPAYTIFGGGGHRIAFLESNRDSLLDNITGLRADINDLGFDSYYQTAQVPIPNFMLKNGYIRFRVRVDAKNDAKQYSISDDPDIFYIKDIKFQSADEISDLEITEVLFDTPFSLFPKDHNVQIPIKIRIRNTCSKDSPPTYARLVIKNDIDSSFDSSNLKNGYSELIYISSLKSYSDTLVECRPIEINNKYFSGMKRFLKVFAFFENYSGDFNSDNDSLLARIEILKSDGFGYDFLNSRNDVGDELGIPMKGLGLHAYSSYDYNYNTASGYLGGNGSGQLAVKFELSEDDTVFGFGSYFTPLNSSPDNILFSIYNNTNGLPGDKISGSDLQASRGYDSRLREFYFDKYINYLYKKPLILPKGIYWASVYQLGESSFELGGSKYRMGMVTTVYDSNMGKRGKSIFINKFLSTKSKDSSGKEKIENKSLFAYRNSDSVNNWISFSPNEGNPAYAHLTHSGLVNNGYDSVKTYTRGTWVPMLRLIMDGQYYKPNDVKEELNQNIVIYPNPAWEYIEISNPSEGFKPSEGYIRIFDVLGECVISVETQHAVSLHRIDVTGLVAGIYFLRIGDWTGKFVKGTE